MDVVVFMIVRNVRPWRVGVRGMKDRGKFLGAGRCLEVQTRMDSAGRKIQEP